MAPGWRTEHRAEEVPKFGAGIVRSCVSALAASVPPLDVLLRGMVGAGQGTQAICLYLGLSRMAFDEHLVCLGLPTPHDRPPRSGGKRPWSLLDTVRLIAWRTAGVHPESIGLRLDRSIGSVRSKCRRLGVPAPPRQELVRLDPAELPDVRLDWWLTGLSVRHLTPFEKCGRPAGAAKVGGGASAGHSASAQPGSPRGKEAAAAPSSTCSAAARRGGRPGNAAPLLGDLAPIAAPIAAKAPRSARAAELAPLVGQREMPLLQVVGGEERRSGQAADSAAVASIGFPRTESEVDFTADLTWIGRLQRSVQSERVAVHVIGMLFLGGLHWLEISRLVGIRPSVLKDLRHPLGIPRCDRSKICRVFDETLARATREDTGYVVKRCSKSGRFFWGRQGDGVCLCPQERRRRGFVDDGGGRRSPWVNVLTHADLAEMQRPARHSQMAG